MRRRFWRALAAGAVLIGGVGAAWGISHHRPSYDVSPGSVLVSADGRVITLADNVSSCGEQAYAVVTESSSAVTIMERNVKDSAQIGCSLARGPNVLAVRLRDPVGRRVLLDGITGRRLTWFDQRRELRPTYLPAGFSGLSSGYSASHSTMPWLYPGGVPQTVLGVPPEQDAVCTQLFDGSVGSLTITQLVGTAGDTLFKLGLGVGGQAVDVRGHPGWYGGYRLTWYENGQRILIVASAPRLSPQGGAQLLLAVARGLR